MFVLSPSKLQEMYDHWVNYLISVRKFKEPGPGILKFYPANIFRTKKSVNVDK